MPFSARPWIAPRANVALRMPPPEMHKALTGAEGLPAASPERMALRSAAAISSKESGGSRALGSNMPADYVREAKGKSTSSRVPVLGIDFHANADVAPPFQLLSYRPGQGQSMRTEASVMAPGSIVAVCPEDTDDEDREFRTCRYLAETYFTCRLRANGQAGGPGNL